MVNIEKLVRIAGEYAEEYYTSGLTGISTSMGSAEIQLTRGAFLETFDSWVITNRDCTEYPFRWNNVVGGVTFFCISEDR